jgi:hypothetical protein
MCWGNVNTNAWLGNFVKSDLNFKLARLKEDFSAVRRGDCVRWASRKLLGGLLGRRLLGLLPVCRGHGGYPASSLEEPRKTFFFCTTAAKRWRV